MASTDFVGNAKRLGFDVRTCYVVTFLTLGQSILMQVGRIKRESIPALAVEGDDSDDRSGSFIRYYHFKPSLLDDIQQAALVISHAGAALASSQRFNL